MPALFNANDVTSNSTTITEVPPPPTDERGCPLEAYGFEIFNDKACPATAASGTCTAEQDGAACNWGKETCCGLCSASFHCDCKDGRWLCLYTDACFSPDCYVKDWNSLTGSTCEMAQTEILAAFPGMIATCLTETEPMPKEDDLERYIVVVDASGLVTDVVLNRNAECPAANILNDDKSCSVTGQKCKFVINESTTEGQTCTETEICTCQFGLFSCDEKSLKCINSPPKEEGTPTIEIIESGCPPALEGAGFESFNDIGCPAKLPLLGVLPGAEWCTAEGLSCQYGMETCSGKCHSSERVSCSEGSWIIGYVTSDACCLFPTCFRRDWSALIGVQCEQAKTVVLAAYPGIDVYCQVETDAMPTKDDLERYIIVTNTKGIVINIFFNRNTEDFSLTTGTSLWHAFLLALLNSFLLSRQLR